MQRLDNLELTYQGRQAKRRDSLQRRNGILEATLRIMVRDGIREIRHRAVAKEADVPLSATTYYFDTIECLIHDAFVYFVEKNFSQIQLLEQSAWIALEEFQRHGDSRKLKASLASFLLSHVQNQVADKDARILEWSFRQEALRDAKLAALYQQPQLMMCQAIEQFFATLGKGQARERAHILMATLYHLEYQLLSHPQSKLDLSQAGATLVTLLEGPLFELTDTQ
ncbi:TetR/AcrR family transcriptional regulator [Bowmanella dokdonensis]|uniref:TetR/AcrR family transcriptional regulator n=1 Tax=Bowmanella dokdonensis TaxID=751969 RepID=A0A939DRG6_9ALTE|nr:TetR/AcrR family transcriptional regulator [Bowmanella dokdonensis]MBN7826596.1 TetR/AcrR family transcriptional regulator [Bowmanella dokdonensis]